MFGIRKPIEDGVIAGLNSAFRVGGPFTKMLDDALKPIFDELHELRRYKKRHQWLPVAEAPDWLLDGRAVLVARFGDVFFASYHRGEDGDYWDTDIEYGGSAVEPPPTHVLILPKLPPPPATTDGESPAEAAGRAPKPSTRGRG